MKPRNNPESYRPLSLTSNVAKVLEKVVKKQLQNYMEEKHIIVDAQHGFRSKRSCLSQLLKHYNDIVESLEQGQVQDVLYLDFSKAFDTVDRYILARHMLNAGITEKAAAWLFTFLNERTQQVISDKNISAPVAVKSGVPQGTVLGPQLFLLMINSITEDELSSKIGIFADDTRLSKGITNEEDICLLQKDLDTIFSWKEKNNMRFNSDKFQLLRHGSEFKSNRNIPRSQYVTDEQEIIKTKNVVLDLGIIMSSSTEFHDQILQICKRARDKSNWIFRSFYSRDVVFLRFMWMCYIQPLMDYGSQLWSPIKQLEIKMLEDVFRNFSARAQNDNKETLDFWTRICRYNIRSQQRRSERFRILYSWKIMENMTPNCGISWNENDKTGRYCSIPSIPLKASDRVKSIKLAAFQTRGPKLFNALLFYLRNISGCSLNKFKNQLDNYLNKFPDTPLSQKYFPLPMDINSCKPSNSIIDWTRYFKIPIRTNRTMEEISKDIQCSEKYVDIQNSEWSHILPSPLQIDAILTNE